jgi:hypothetical protein
VLQVQQQQQLGSVLFQYWLKPKNKELSEKKFFVPPTFYSVIFKYFSFRLFYFIAFLWTFFTLKLLLFVTAQLFILEFSFEFLSNCYMRGVI